MSLNKKTLQNNKNEDKKEKTEDVENKNENVENKSEEEDMVTEMNKQMSILMPAMTVSIALIAPLGLALYWLVSNLLMIVERIVVNKFFKEEEEA